MALGNSTGKNFAGALLIDKPVGPTSHDVVACARRALGERSIGHTGTLDPLASGLLVLLVGRATRLASLLSGAQKTYDATLQLGVETDTFDAAGTPQPVEHATTPEAVEDMAIEVAVQTVADARQQVPPAFSAKKVDGVRAYTLARRQERPDLKPVDVQVFAIAWTRPAVDRLEVTLTCSAGYYVRAMAHEIGRLAGCGAHLTALRRTEVGVFKVTDAVTLDDLEREGRDSRDAARAHLLPVEVLLPHLPAAHLTDTGIVRARHGNILGLQHVARWDTAPTNPPIHQPTNDPVRYRLLSPDGHLVAIAEASPAGLQPRIVL